MLLLLLCNLAVGCMLPPADILEKVPEAAQFCEIYAMSIPLKGNFATGVPYSVNNSDGVRVFDRVAYYFQLDDDWVFVSLKNFTASDLEIGVPHCSGCISVVHATVGDVNVYSEEGSIRNLGTGVVEFFSGDYMESNFLGVPHASSSVFDFGDDPAYGGIYGCMQVHLYDVDGDGPATHGRVLFAMNALHADNNLDLGIGTQPVNSPDWTFAGNSATYTIRRLVVMVREQLGDCSNPSFGPGGEGCRHASSCVDGVPGDGAFTCNCTGTGAHGDNCETVNVCYAPANNTLCPVGWGIEAGCSVDFCPQWGVRRALCAENGSTFGEVPCEPCPEGCATCSSSSCLSCLLGFGLQGNACEACAPGCLLCAVTNSTELGSGCDKCVPGVFDDNGVAPGGHCSTACAPGYVDATGGDIESDYDCVGDCSDGANGPGGTGCLGGICVDTVLQDNNFTCACWAGFVGPTCECAGSPAVTAKVPRAAEFCLVYELSIGTSSLGYNTIIPYTVDHSDLGFAILERIAYFIELDTEWVYIEMDAFAALKEMGVPGRGSNGYITVHKQFVTNMIVKASPGVNVTQGEGIATGVIEFWSFNYGGTAQMGLGNSNYDWDDTPGSSGDHGCMQFFNIDVDGPGPKGAEVIFSLTSFNSGTPGLGFGTYSGASPDYTFASNANEYSTRKITVLAKGLFGDCLVAAFGPNGRGCLHGGTCVDAIRANRAFVCNCSGTGYSGDNCDIAEGCPTGSTSPFPSCDCNFQGYAGEVSWNGTAFNHTCDAIPCHAASVGSPPTCGACTAMEGYITEPTWNGTWQCLPCSVANCASCPGDVCSSCQTGYISTGICVTACPSRWYGVVDVDDVCRPCLTADCTSCPNNVCDHCASGFILAGGECVSSCPPTSYGVVDVDVSCEACSDMHCLTCPDDVCSLCSSSFILSVGGVCGTACPAGERGVVDVDVQCQACSVENCATCPADACSSCLPEHILFNVSNCRSACPPGYYGKVNVAVSCTACSDALCDTCPDDTCALCVSSHILSMSGQCVSECPYTEDGTPGVDVQCSPMVPKPTADNSSIANNAGSFVLRGKGFLGDGTSPSVTLGGPGAGGALCSVGSYNFTTIVCNVANEFASVGGLLRATVVTSAGTSSATQIAIVLAAPTVSPGAASVRNDALKLNITGTGFGLVSGAVSVYFSGEAAGSAVCSVLSVDQTRATCALSGTLAPAGGSLLATVEVIGRGVSAAASVASILPAETCGNGVVEGSEECDDGDTSPGDGCSTSCVTEDGYTCPANSPCVLLGCAPGSPADCAAVCGGTAFIDECGDCAAGTTGRIPGAAKDDCNVCRGGNADVDICGVCFGEGRDTDECGVCFGDNATCLGCDDIPNSGKTFDVCGICGGDGSSCLGCDGVPIPDGGSQVDACGVCGGSASTCVFGCNGIPNAIFDCFGTCNGTAVIDNCGVCAGGNTNVSAGSHQDGCGVCFGGRVSMDQCGLCPDDDGFGVALDICGVCFGTGLSCTDCAGVVHGNATYDACGICGGSDACLGCNGLPFGAGGLSFDLNHDCGGTCVDREDECALSCIDHSLSPVSVDCAGVCGGSATVDGCGMCTGGSTGLSPRAAMDRCGVCFGADGTIDACGRCANGSSSPLVTLDMCGLCGGDNSTCTHVDLDACGVPNGDNSTCTSGSCGSGVLGLLYYDACGECGGNETDSSRCAVGCDGFPNSTKVFDCLGNCGGSHALDACGVCSADTSHVPFLDACSVCFGRNRDRDDCGICFPESPSRDDCGVCFGANRDHDACGVCRGRNRTQDSCGVCGGDGRSCLGCDGVPNSHRRVNACGRCESELACNLGNVRASASAAGRPDTITTVGLATLPFVVLLLLAVVAFLVFLLVKRQRSPGGKYMTVLVAMDPVDPVLPIGDDVTVVASCLEHVELLVTRAPDKIFAVVRTFNDIIRWHAEEEGGVLITTTHNEPFETTVVFQSSLAAVQFACKVQVSLLNQPWEPAILQCPHWEEEGDNTGDVVYRGPRVQMGACRGHEVHIGTDKGVLDFHGASVEQARFLARQAFPGSMLATSDIMSRATLQDERCESLSHDDEDALLDSSSYCTLAFDQNIGLISESLLTVVPFAVEPRLNRMRTSVRHDHPMELEELSDADSCPSVGLPGEPLITESVG